jgi:hypothetical protein
MKEILRLHEGSDTITDWQNSVRYGIDVINQIKDPDGASAKKEITSIPSPFARIDLVKTAFREIIDCKELDGETIYHKMISDSFDIGEIFFNFDKLREKFKIVIWDRDTDLNKLVDSTNPAHKAVYETLNMYLIEDAKGTDPYNFGKMKRIYLLNYVGPDRPGNMNIIGATSPCTLFFSSANDLRYISQHVQFGRDKVFDGVFKPLYKRDFKFQKYLYAFKKNYGNRFATDFNEVNEYLNQNYRKLLDGQKREIDDLTDNSIGQYETLSVDDNTVDILNHPLHKCPPTPFHSDFEIKTTVFHGDKIPLVLPIESGNTYADWTYTNDAWGGDSKAPVSDSTFWHDRELPDVCDKYPYLTISDFLEDTIIRMPFEINEGSFFAANCDGKGYLLPLKNTFFEFFTVEQLKEKLSSGQKMFELNRNAGGVQVVLRIPVKNNVIEYRRLYFENSKSPNVEKNEGALKNLDFEFALFPKIKFNNSDDAHYRLGLICDFNSLDQYEVACYSSSSGNVGLNSDIVRNSDRQEHEKCKVYILENNNFDYIQIKYNQNCRGIIVPEFKVENSAKQFTFAIDLGTTNTHIEYSINEGNSIIPASPFDVGHDDAQIQLLTIGNRLNRNKIFDDDLLPGEVGKNKLFHFPIRTALSEAEHITRGVDSVYPMADASIAFYYEKRDALLYNRTIPNLKWSNARDDRKRVQSYIESLFLIIRNKVLLNDGDLSATKIVWFYPVAMTQHRFDMFNKIWQDAYKKYFSSNNKNITYMTESVAPYAFYRGTIGNASDMVTIDIGGGTSDITIADENGVKYITSFRFAANSVFGDGYADNVHGLLQNGIVRQFKNQIFNVLNTQEVDDLKRVFVTMDRNNISAEIVSFLFSLNNNKNIRDRNLAENVDLNSLLREDETQKIVFLFFYAAIIYHLAHILKAKQSSMPRHIAFSGNGSKIIQILAADNKVLEKFTKLIFEKIFKDQYSKDLTIICDHEISKEITCKGGVSNYLSDEYSDTLKKKVVLKGSDNQSFINSETYGGIDEDDYISKTTSEAKKFIEFIIGLNNCFSFKNNFGVSIDSIEIAKRVCFVDLETYTRKGLSLKRTEVVDGDTIEETFFFYPLIGMLHALGNEIFKSQSSCAQ